MNSPKSKFRPAPGGAELLKAVPRPPDNHNGDWLLKLNWALTGLFAVVTVLAIFIHDIGTRAPALVMALLLFFGGCLLIGLAVVKAAQRSRTAQLDIITLFFPTRRVTALRPQLQLYGAGVVQLGMGILGAALQPSTTLAFGTLAWIFGLGLSGVWAASHGAYATRSD